MRVYWWLEDGHYIPRRFNFILTTARRKKYLSIYPPSSSPKSVVPETSIAVWKHIRCNFQTRTSSYIIHSNPKTIQTIISNALSLYSPSNSWRPSPALSVPGSMHLAEAITCPICFIFTFRKPFTLIDNRSASSLNSKSGDCASIQHLNFNMIRISTSNHARPHCARLFPSLPLEKAATDLFGFLTKVLFRILTRSRQSWVEGKINCSDPGAHLLLILSILKGWKAKHDLAGI